jgi:hypothetical protein
MDHVVVSGRACASGDCGCSLIFLLSVVFSNGSGNVG